MSLWLIALVAVLVVAVVAVAVAATAVVAVRRRTTPSGPVNGSLAPARRILFPFVAGGLSMRALDAALRLARAEDASLVPVFLACVTCDLPLDTPIPRQAAVALPLQEAVECQAARAGIIVEPRIERGRTHRHALQLALMHEPYDQIVIAAAGGNQPGFKADDVAWLLDHAAGEIVVLRASEHDLSATPADVPADVAA